jgi:hypothetical protein
MKGSQPDKHASMKLTLEPTPEFVSSPTGIDRLWAGCTENGTPVCAVVTFVGCDREDEEAVAELAEVLTDPETHPEFERELRAAFLGAQS